MAISVFVIGCSVDPAVVVNVGGRALDEVQLVAPSSPVTGGGSYHWEVISTPAASSVHALKGAATAILIPDVRGQYLIERWYTLGLGDDLTHRFIVDIHGLPPVATLQAAQSAINLGMDAMLDGTQSASAEGLPLTYHWRIAMRPIDSSASISQGDAEASFIPDVAGAYTVELSVFDGELWSDQPAIVTINAI